MRWLIDLDGVIWRSTTLIEGSDVAVRTIRERGDSIRFVTNNSTLTRRAYVTKLASMGIEASPDEILTSGMAAALALGTGQRVLAIGEEGLTAEVGLGNELVAPATLDEAETVDAVVLGWHRGFNWDLLAKACVAVRAGARFFATNRDPTYPLERHIVPGTGALVASLTSSTSVEPTFCGKPDWPMVDLARPHVLEGSTIMVGDRLSTDGAFARTLGVPFGWATSGIVEHDGGSVPIALRGQSLLALVRAVDEDATDPATASPR